MGTGRRLAEMLLRCLRQRAVEPRSRIDDLGVRLGSFDADPGVRPSFRQYVAYAASWEPIPDDGLPRFPERRTT